MTKSILNKVADELAELEQQLSDFKSSVKYLKDAKSSVDTAVNTIKQAENYHLEKIVEIQTVYDGFDKILSDVKVLSEKLNSVDFPKRLSTIEKRLDEVITGIEKGLKTSLEEVKLASKAITNADFDKKFQDLSKLLSDAKTNIDSSKVKIETGLGNVIQKNTEHAANVQSAVEKSNTKVGTLLSGLNFPVRMDKLDASVAGITAGVQSLQSRLDNLERNIMDRIRDISDQQKVTFLNISKTQNDAFIAIQGSIEIKAKKQQVLTFVTWGLIVTAIIIIFVLKYKLPNNSGTT